MPIKEKEKNNEDAVVTNLNTQRSIKETDKQNNQICFVITPIGGENEPIRRHIDGIYDAAIVPVLEEFDYKPEIPHRISIPGSINKQIIKKIYDSDLIIANLTDINPNVMYELALRHCFNKPVVIIAETGTELPFDINNERTIFYLNDAQGILDLKKKLRKTILEIKNEEKEKYSSPVISVLGELKLEEQLLKRKDKGNKEDDFLGSLQMILRRLDRIEYDSKNNSNNYRFSESYISRLTYRIHSPQNYERDFETVISYFIESCRNNNIRFRTRSIDSTTYQISFYDLKPESADFIISDLRAFCDHFGLVFERI